MKIQTEVLDDEINCFHLSDEMALLKIKDSQFVLDYSQLMDLLYQMTSTGSHMEELQTLPKSLN